MGWGSKLCLIQQQIPSLDWLESARHLTTLNPIGNDGWNPFPALFLIDTVSTACCRRFNSTGNKVNLKFKCTRSRQSVAHPALSRVSKVPTGKLEHPSRVKSLAKIFPLDLVRPARMTTFLAFARAAKRSILYFFKISLSLETISRAKLHRQQEPFCKDKG